MLSFLLSFLVCFILSPAVIRFASQRRWFDIPDARKIHQPEIPRLGGVAIMGATLISILLVAGSDTILNTRYFLAGLLILFFVGLWDDLQPVKPWVKLLGELIPVGLLTWSTRLPLHTLFPEISWMPVLEWPATVILVFWSINAYNLIDGINGLAGSLGLLALLGMGTLDGKDSAYLCLATAGALLAFLYYNFLKPRIFMGDGGSLPVGYFLAFGLTRFGGESGDPEWPSHFFLAFSLMSLPLFDMARVFAIRVRNGKNPFLGDRNHLHHLLLESGLSHVGATLQLTLLALSTALLVGALQSLALPQSYLFASALIVMVAGPLLFTAVLWLKVRKIRQQVPSKAAASMVYNKTESAA